MGMSEHKSRTIEVMMEKVKTHENQPYPEHNITGGFLFLIEYQDGQKNGLNSTQ